MSTRDGPSLRVCDAGLFQGRSTHFAAATFSSANSLPDLRCRVAP
jgi:hypothetical protein